MNARNFFMLVPEMKIEEGEDIECEGAPIVFDHEFHELNEL